MANDPRARALASTGDCVSPEACVHALYDVISGPPEAERDWGRFRALCRPDAQFLLASRQVDGALLTQTYEVDNFIREGSQAFAERGLWESELVGHTNIFGRVAQVFSAYETRLDRADAPVVARGVNCIQLVEDPEAVWRIAHLAWDREAPGQPLPPALSAGGGNPTAT